MALSKRTDRELADVAHDYWQMGAEVYSSYSQEEHLLRRIDQVLQLVGHELTQRGIDFDQATYSGEIHPLTGSQL